MFGQPCQEGSVGCSVQVQPCQTRFMLHHETSVLWSEDGGGRVSRRLLRGRKGSEVRSCRLTTPAYHSPTPSNSLPPTARVKSYSYSVIVRTATRSKAARPGHKPRRAEHCKAAVTSSTTMVTMTPWSAIVQVTHSTCSELSCPPSGKLFPDYKSRRWSAAEVAI